MIKHVVVFLSLLFWLYSADGLDAQEQFTHYTTDQGLSDNIIRCFEIDADGFLWIGTHSGLSRFDGKTFTNYYSDPLDSASVCSNLITTLETDRHGNLWVGTNNNGLSILDQKSGKFKHFAYASGDSLSLPGNHVASIYKDVAGRIWVSCFGAGLALYNEKTHNFKTYRFDTRTEGYNFNEIKDIKPDAEGHFWMSTRVGLIRFNPNSGSHEKIVQEGGWAKNGYSMVCPGPDGKIYTGSWDQGIYCYDPKDKIWSQYLIEPNSTFGYNQVPDILFLDSETILFSCYLNGFGKLNLSTKKVSYLKDNYPDVLALKTRNGQQGTRLLKTENGVFMGSFGGVFQITEALPGLRIYDGSVIHHTSFDSSIAVVSSVIAIPGDTLLYAGTYYRAGMYAFNHQGGKVLRSIPYPNDRTSYHVSESFPNPFKENSWLIACSLGLLEFQPPDKISPAFDFPIFTSYVTSACVSKDGFIWIISDRHVYSWKPGQEPEDHTEAIKKSCSIQSFHPLTLCSGFDGRIWIVTNARDLIGYHPKDRSSLVFSQQIAGADSPGGDVEQVIPLPDSSLWLNISNLGIAHLQPYSKEILFTGRHNGLSGTRIGCISLDGSGNLWMVHENGISVLVKESGLVRNFGRSYGLVFSTPNYIGTAADGLIYAGGENRIVGFHPETLLHDNVSGTVYVTDIRLFHTPYDSSRSAQHIDTLELAYNQNYLSFDFTVPDVSARSDFYYFSKLDGFDQQWISCGTLGQINYSGLPPGKYRLLLRAKNAAGEWCSPEKQIVIIIHPPFWKTAWFILISIFLFLSLIFLIYRMRVRAIRRQAEEKNKLAERLRELENQALRSQMNPHFIFNCLNSINSYIVKSKPDEASMYVTKFSRLIRLILENSRSSTITLEHELAALKLYIEMENLRFNNSLDYDIQSEDGLEQIPMPPMIIQPFVENAIWHGLLHSDHKGLLELKLSKSEGNLICSIRDNGVGREAAAAFKSKTSLKKKSLGMTVTKNRIRSYNRSSETNEDVIIHDLKDANGLPSGTEVILKIRIYHDTY